MFDLIVKKSVNKDIEKINKDDLQRIVDAKFHARHRDEFQMSAIKKD